MIRTTRAAAKKRIRPLAKAVLPVVERLAGSKAPSPGKIKSVATKTGRSASAPGKTLQASLSQGSDYLASIFAEVRRAIDEGHAQAVLSSVLSPTVGYPRDEVAQAIAGLARLRISGNAAAWSTLRELRDEAVIDVVAEEFFMSGFSEDSVQASEILRTTMNDKRHTEWGAGVLLHIAQEAYASGDLEAASTLIDVGLNRPTRSMTGQQRREMNRLLTWFPDGDRRTPQKVDADGINFGLLSYQQPHGWSRNVGDYIQTLASIGHTLRYEDLEFHGEKDVVEFLRKLKKDVKPERKLPGGKTKLNLVEVYRDASTLQDIPASTWTLAFGWFMHPMFGQGSNFPFHENIRPLFISFHVNKPSMLTPDAIDYLRRYGPVGCRDWQTVALLRAAGVPAFFSGCLTTTVDTVFRRDAPDTRAETVYVDSPVSGPGTVLKQSQPNMLKLSFVEKLTTAHQWVNGYHENYKYVSTSRLHCFLPSRSVGCEVNFLPKNRSDVRFGGLIDTDDHAFDAIRTGILDKVATVLPMVFEGRSEADVYAAWEEVCAPAMAEADDFLDARPSLTLDGSTLGALEETSAELRAKQRKDALQLVIDLVPGERPHVEKLLASVAKTSDTPVDLWIVATDDESWVPIEPSEPHIQVHVIGSDSPLSRTLMDVIPTAPLQGSVLSMLPGVLRAAGRVLLLNGSAMIRGDLREMAAHELGGSPIAALDERRKGRISGFHLMRSISERHRNDNRRALEFIDVSHHSNVFDFSVMDPSVAIIDTAIFAELNVSIRVLELLANYEVDFPEALNIVVGQNRGSLNNDLVFTALHTPTETRNEPVIVNWRHTQKPWNNIHTPFAPEWMRL